MSDIVLISFGECIPVDPTESSFAHGFGLFETMRYADGRLYFWADHWARLSRSARHFGLAVPEESAALDALRSLVTKSAIKAATLKLSLVKTMGGSRLYVYARPPMSPVATRRLRLEADAPIFPASLLAGHKTHNYMESMYLLNRARADGYDDCLRVDARGYLAETAVANLFFMKDGQLHTPSLATGILPGVTRAALLRAAELAIEEGLYTPETLQEAEAVFVTNATFGLQPIERIEGFTQGRATSYPESSAPLEAILDAFTRVEAAAVCKLI
jgi:branched-subunit amino acid aminotransferase/4-amino-4-deoxychorismate lyase